MKVAYKKLLQQVSEYNSDPLTLLAQAEELRRDSIEVGYISEKIANRVEGGVAPVLERFPQVALQAIRLKFDILKWIQERADLEQEDNTECKLVIVGGVDMTPPDTMRKYGE